MSFKNFIIKLPKYCRVLLRRSKNVHKITGFANFPMFLLYIHWKTFLMVAQCIGTASIMGEIFRLDMVGYTGLFMNCIMISDLWLFFLPTQRIKKRTVFHMEILFACSHLFLYMILVIVTSDIFRSLRSSIWPEKEDEYLIHPYSFYELCEITVGMGEDIKGNSALIQLPIPFMLLNLVPKFVAFFNMGAVEIAHLQSCRLNNSATAAEELQIWTEGGPLRIIYRKFFMHIYVSLKILITLLHSVEVASLMKQVTEINVLGIVGLTLNILMMTNNIILIWFRNAHRKTYLYLFFLEIGDSLFVLLYYILMLILTKNSFIVLIFELWKNLKNEEIRNIHNTVLQKVTVMKKNVPFLSLPIPFMMIKFVLLVFVYYRYSLWKEDESEVRFIRVKRYLLHSIRYHLHRYSYPNTHVSFLMKLVDELMGLRSDKERDRVFGEVLAEKMRYKAKWERVRRLRGISEGHRGPLTRGRGWLKGRTGRTPLVSNRPSAERESTTEEFHRLMVMNILSARGYNATNNH